MDVVDFSQIFVMEAAKDRLYVAVGRYFAIADRVTENALLEVKTDPETIRVAFSVLGAPDGECTLNVAWFCVSVLEHHRVWELSRWGAENVLGDRMGMLLLIQVFQT